MLNFVLKKNDLLSPTQSGFWPGDSCVTKMLSINHEIPSASDLGLEVQGLLLDIPKVFDKVWLAELVYKLRQNGICGDLMNTLSDFLIKRKRRIVLNRRCSSWVDIRLRAGVLQGSIHGPFFCFWYMSMTYQMALKENIS